MIMKQPKEENLKMAKPTWPVLFLLEITPLFTQAKAECLLRQGLAAGLRHNRQIPRFVGVCFFNEKIWK